MCSNVRKMWSPREREINTQYDVTNYGGESDVILGIYLTILGDDIFRTFEHIESNKPYYATLIGSLLLCFPPILIN